MEQKIQACHILAKCYLAMDDAEKTDSILKVLVSLKENFEPDSDDPESLKYELMRIKANIITTVSKFSEDIRLAPATAIVITQEEIQQRGYNDLIEVLKDIPGFDISIYYGQLYANVYQRGFRSSNTLKTLLMIDGVEENDLWSNFADISQQYPLINIKRIEVIYGPASTMYGPNAFSGVINVITKEPLDYLKNGKSFSIHANAGIGTYNTKYLELSAAYKKEAFSFSITGRMYYSDRPDLSTQKLWDYDKGVFEDGDVYRYKTRIPGAQQYMADNGLPSTSTYYKVVRDTLILTPVGGAEAKRLNNLLVSKDSVTGFDYTAFINPSKSVYLNARFNIANLSFGFISWGKTEGIGTTYTDLIASVSGSEWKPAHYTAYMNYSKTINSKLHFTASLNYKIHAIRNGSKITSLLSYAPFGGLNIKDLVLGVPAHWLTTYYFEQSGQYRSEFNLLYTRSKNFYIISGIELRNSQLQGYFLTDTITSVPQNNGAYPYNDSSGGNQYNVNDIGVYSQGTYRTKNGFGFTAGVRFDYNEIRQGGGLGSQLSPRFVFDYANRKNWVFKAIMSKGVQNVSNFTKFDVVNLEPNISLNFESIYNYELSVWKSFSKSLSADIDFFYSKINNVVEAELAKAVLKNVNVGGYEIKGIQSNLYLQSKNQKWQGWINYTYTDPKQTKSFVEATGEDTSVNLRIADIASHKVNAGVNMIFLKNLNINIRANYVSSKKAGDTTAARTTALRNPINSFDSYITANITIGLHNLFKDVLIQLVCNNVFDKIYYSPGIRSAGGVRSPDQILQMGRAFYLKLSYEF